MPRFANTAPKRVGPKPKVYARFVTPYRVYQFLSHIAAYPAGCRFFVDSPTDGNVIRMANLLHRSGQVLTSWETKTRVDSISGRETTVNSACTAQITPSGQALLEILRDLWKAGAVDSFRQWEEYGIDPEA